MIRLIVYKDGPNRGRQFFSCPQGVGKDCPFFSWVSDDKATTSLKTQEQLSVKPQMSHVLSEIKLQDLKSSSVTEKAVIDLTKPNDCEDSELKHQDLVISYVNSKSNGNSGKRNNWPLDEESTLLRFARRIKYLKSQISSPKKTLCCTKQYKNL